MDSSLAIRFSRILKRNPVEFGYLFGSVSEGKAGPASDIDVGVFLAPKLSGLERQRSRLRICRELLAASTPAAGAMDLVLLNEAPLGLAFSVVQGRLLFSRNERQRIAFEAGTRSRYFDRLYYTQRSAETFLRRTASRGLMRPC